MKNETFPYWTKSGNTLYESTQALTEINTKAFTQLTEQQQALGYVIPRGLPYCPLY
jgi:hypothetical protein